MIHILGIAGTFMAGIANLAKESGLSVTGSDMKTYPPMSTLLDKLGISVEEGYTHTSALDGKTIIIGNALSRGNQAVEYILNHKLPYISGPQWLHENILREKTVMAVAGTHGKTSTASMLAWICDIAETKPGFLIGGKPGNFEHSARLGGGDLFILEADEYDTAFFDKRSKFMHYHPHIAILNNLEYDHADIFANLGAIKTQFRHLIRTIAQNGALIVNADDENLKDVINMGCWTPVITFSSKDDSADWFARTLDNTCRHFEILHADEKATVQWPGMGEHNMSNALGAIAAAYQVGISLEQACTALATFRFPDKRLQQHATTMGFTLYEDFAHHPTAIHKTLQALHKAHPGQRLIAIVELRSNTMQSGHHQLSLAPALMAADMAYMVKPSSSDWNIDNTHPALQQFEQTRDCLKAILPQLNADDVVVVMSNGSFDDIVNTLTRAM